MSRSTSRSSTPTADRQPPESSVREKQEYLLSELMNYCAFPLEEIRSQLSTVSQADAFSDDDDIPADEEMIAALILQYSGAFVALKRAVMSLQKTLESELDDDKVLADFNARHDNIRLRITTLKNETILFASEWKNRLQLQGAEDLARSWLDFKRLRQLRVTECKEIKAECEAHAKLQATVPESVVEPVSIPVFDEVLYATYCAEVRNILDGVNAKMKALAVPFSLQEDIQKSYAKVSSLCTIFLNPIEAKKFKRIDFKYSEILIASAGFNARVAHSELNQKKPISYFQTAISFFSSLSVSKQKEERKPGCQLF